MQYQDMLEVTAPTLTDMANTAPIAHTNVSPKLPNGMVFDDINYDNSMDVGLQDESSGEGNVHFRFYTYSTSSDSLVRSNLIPVDWFNPTFDSKAQTVTTYDNQGAAGDFYQSETYHWNGKSYELVSRVTSGGDLCGLTRTTEEMQNGKMVVTKSEQLGPDPDFCHK